MTGVNRGVEELEPGHPHYESNVGGRGGAANIGTGPGHYDTTGAREETDLSGRGGAGNMFTTGTYGAPSHGTHGDSHTQQKATVADKVIGSAQVAIGKVTKNPALVEKGVERKVEGSQHHVAPTAPGTHGAQITEPGHAGELKNRAI